MKISKYVRLGILVVFALLVLGWGINFLNGNDIFNKSNEYYVVYTRVDGLEKSNKVVLKGYQVGKVADIRFANEKNDALIVTLRVRSDIKVPTDTEARIISSDIMGTRSIDLRLGESNNVYSSGDTLHSSVEEELKDQISRQVLPIKEKTEELLSSIDSAVTTLNIILNKDARQNLKNSFANINKSVQNIEAFTSDVRYLMASRRGNIERTLVNLDSITCGLKNNMQNVDNTLANLSTFSDSLSLISLSQIVGNVEKTTKQVEDMIIKVSSNSSSVGLLLNDDELYYKINDLTTNLDKLVKDLRFNPSRYLSLSVIDWSKDIYVNPDISSESKSIKFFVTAYVSPVPLDVESEVFKGLKDIKDRLYKGDHYYYTVDTYFYTEALKELDKVRELIPSVSIVAFRNGRKLKLEKALRILAE